MDYSNRNKLVALRRWAKVNKKEKEQMLNSKESMVIRSALCGFIAGDGSLQIRKEKTFYHYQLDFFPDDTKMLNIYISFLEKIYRKIPSVCVRDNVYHARISSKLIVNDLNKYANFSTNNWDFPEDLFHFPGAKEFWLKGFFSAEAYVNKKQIRIQTVNEKGMINVSKLLNNLNIKNNLYYYQPKKLNCQKVTIVVISDKKSRKIFFDKIGFWHDKKVLALKKALDL